MTPEQIRDRDLFPQGFQPLPHANHPEGGMVFPNFEIQELLKQEQRDLTRFDLDFDIPEHFLPEFPPAIYLTTRPDLGDVSKGQLVTIENYYDLFNGILNPKQIEGAQAAAHSVSPATVQSNRRSSFGEAEPRRSLL
jgi:cytochrome c peroxidase